jgi:hypothetical protein
MDPNTVPDLQRRFSGLNDDLTYIIKEPKHTIEAKYTAYKDAHDRAKASNTAYSEVAELRKIDVTNLTKPYPSHVKGPVKQTYYTTAENHGLLATLASTAAQHAKE